jgi:uncharacterized membrane protein YvbJ
MICQNCGSWVNVDRESCPTCGVFLNQPQYLSPSTPQSTVLTLLKEEENKKRRNMTMGLVIFIIGIALLPILIFTYDAFIGWFVCGGAFICIFAGIIVILTNTVKK